MTDELPLGDQVRILWGDVRIISPALDSNPTETLLLSVPLPGIRAVRDKRGNLLERGEMVLCTVTSKREIFETTDQEFMKRGWLASMPQTIPEQRWSADSIKAFVGGASPVPDLWKTFRDVREKFEWYVDFDNQVHGPTVCAVYTLATYFFFLFEYFPYLKLGGEKGVGKTKTGSLFKTMAFNAEIFANASGPAIYRTAQDTRGTMIVDEGEALAEKSDEQLAYLSVLNSGWQRNGKATRVSQDGDRLRVTKWSTYCPKVVCSINGLEEVLGDRAFEIILFRTLDRVKANREVSEGSAEWASVRDELYLTLFRFWDELRELIPSVANPFDFSGRVWNLAKPLVAVARLLDAHRPEGEPSVEAGVASFVREQQEEKAAKAAESFGTTVLIMLRELVKTEGAVGLVKRTGDAPVRIGLKALTEKVREADGSERLDARKVSRALINMELYHDPRRDGSHGETKFEVRPSQLERAWLRLFGRAPPTEATEATEAPKEGLCELCGKPGTLSRTEEGHFACSLCREDLTKTAPEAPQAHLATLKPFVCADCGKECEPFKENFFLKERGHLCRDCFEKRTASRRQPVEGEV